MAYKLTITETQQTHNSITTIFIIIVKYLIRKGLIVNIKYAITIQMLALCLQILCVSSQTISLLEYAFNSANFAADFILRCSKRAHK